MRWKWSKLSIYSIFKPCTLQILFQGILNYHDPNSLLKTPSLLRQWSVLFYLHIRTSPRLINHLSFCRCESTSESQCIMFHYSLSSSRSPHLRPRRLRLLILTLSAISSAFWIDAGCRLWFFADCKLKILRATESSRPNFHCTFIDLLEMLSTQKTGVGNPNRPHVESALMLLLSQWRPHRRHSRHFKQNHEIIFYSCDVIGTVVIAVGACGFGGRLVIELWF